MSDLEDYHDTDDVSFELSKPNLGGTKMQATNTDTQHEVKPQVVGSPLINLTPGLAVILTVVGVGLSALNTMAGLPVWVYSILNFVLPLGGVLGIWSAGPRYQTPVATKVEAPIEAPKPSV